MAFTIENNMPSAGLIRWTNLNMQYLGVSYAIANGNTNYVYVYWTPTSPNTLVVSNTFPTLGPNDCLIFLNRAGTAVTVPTATILDGDLIVPGSIVANALAAGTITGDKIAAGTISASNIVTGTISATQIAAGAIGANAIAVGVITADKLVAGSITTTQIAAGTILATNIAANSITAAKIAAGTITSTEISANTITAGDIAANTITSNLIAATGIVADKIIGGTLTLGGLSNGNGVETIKDAGGNVIATLDNTGVLVNQGSYRIIEDNGAQITVGTKENLIHDSSFENMDFVGSYDATNCDIYTTSNLYWTTINSPRQVWTPYGTSFGVNAIAVNATDAVCGSSDSFGLKSGISYTISAFITPHFNRNTVGAPINYNIKVEVYNQSGGITLTQNFSGVITAAYVSPTDSGTTNNNPVKRVFGTFVAPAISSYVKYTLSSGSATQWLVYDGIQLVLGTYPVAYQPDSMDAITETFKGGSDLTLLGNLKINTGKTLTVGGQINCASAIFAVTESHLSNGTFVDGWSGHVCALKLSGDLSVHGTVQAAGYTLEGGNRALWSTNIIRFGMVEASNYMAIYHTNLTTYGCTTFVSDVSLKKNILDYDGPNVIDKVMAIKIRQFDWIESQGGKHENIGFVSQELMEIDPDYALEIIQPLDEKGVQQPSLYQPDITVLIPTLIKAIQEMQNEIKELKAQIIALAK